MQKIVKEMLPDVKLSLRITNEAFDSEIELLIYAAIADLDISGIDTELIINNMGAEQNTKIVSMLKQAVIFYCKASFGIDNLETDKYMAIYERIRLRLGMSGVYNALD